MKFKRKIVIALCASASLWCFFSCEEEQITVIDLSEISIDSVSVSVTVSDWHFTDGVCEKEMIVGDSVDLPSAISNNSCSWTSNNTTVATVIKESSIQKLKAISVGNAIVSDGNSNYKINVRVKDKN